MVLESEEELIYTHSNEMPNIETIKFYFRFYSVFSKFKYTSRIIKISVCILATSKCQKKLVFLFHSIKSVS